MKIIGIIPARYASTRFPGKPLARIAGKTLLQHVVERCQRAQSLAEVIVATDDTRIWEVAQNFCRAEMTAPEHASGTDRIAEVARNYPCDAVINIQGDEPLLDPAVVDAVARGLERRGNVHRRHRPDRPGGIRQSQRGKSRCQRRRAGPYISRGARFLMCETPLPAPSRWRRFRF